MEFRLDERFRETTLGKEVTIRVAYFDDHAGGKWSLLYQNAGGEVNLGTITKGGTNTWKDAFFVIPDADFINSDYDFVLYNEEDDDDIFQMIEVSPNG